MTETGQASVFGKRREPHTVIIARGDDIRHFTIRPWIVAFFGSVLAAVAVGYLLATSYLVLRDDLLGASAARQARMQQAYEDRISMLRVQVDRITSRQLLDQQLVESKVAELLARQTQLTQRHGRLTPILERAGHTAGSQDGDAQTPPLPTAKPEVRADLGAQPQFGSTQALAFWGTRTSNPTQESAADRADRLFVAINQSLRAIEAEQMDGLDTLAEEAFETADKIVEALEAAGLPVDLDTTGEATGGPLVPLEAAPLFESRVRELDDALEKLEAVKAIALTMPIHNPAPGQAVSSSFGVRRDPILRTPALHAGIDFRASVGTPIRSGGAGTVVKAGWNGGYGRMVEIDHGYGLTTRYAHMSKIRVDEGDVVAAGDVVGEAGSTGRSTGPHLHYEVRRDGKAIDPVRFLRTGKKIGSFM